MSLFIKRLPDLQFRAAATLAKSLGKKINKALVELGITKAAFSQYSGITAAEMSRITEGHNLPSMKRIVRISLLLDISVAELCTLTEEDQDVFRKYNTIEGDTHVQ